MSKKSLSSIIGDSMFGGIRKTVTDMAVDCPSFFAGHELDYFSRRLPYEDSNLGTAATIWSKRVGHRDRMARICQKNGDPADRAEFAYVNESYRTEMKETIDSAEGAVEWASRFPEDADEMREMVGGGEWAFRWAKEVGDVDEMKSRISTTYWQVMFEKEIEEDSSASFVT